MKRTTVFLLDAMAQHESITNPIWWGWRSSCGSGWLDLRTRENARRAGLVERTDNGWRITDKGRAALESAAHRDYDAFVAVSNA